MEQESGGLCPDLVPKDKGGFWTKIKTEKEETWNASRTKKSNFKLKDASYGVRPQ